MYKKNKRFIVGIITLILVLLAIITAFGLNESNRAENQSIIEDKAACIIVKYTTEIHAELISDGIKSKETLADNMELLELTDPSQMERIIEGLEAMEGIEYVQPNYLLKTNVASDEFYPQQWALNNIIDENIVDVNAEAAWDIETGSGNVTVGILDTGIDSTHPDIKKAIKNNGCDFADIMWEVKDPSVDKHGTAIAGIIAAQDNDIGIRGIASDIKITPLKFMDKYKGYTSDAIKAIQYAVNEEIEILNCSFGSDEYNPALQEVMQNSPILFVCAAGNDGRNIDQEPYYPASFDLPNIISVGSINSDGEISSFSNYGSTVDVLAPGENIYSTIPEGKYYSFSGTSMSAAYVTGVAALLKSQNAAISPEEMISQINSTARRYPDYVGKASSGGIVDTYAALTNEAAPISTVPLSEEAVNEATEAVTPASVEGNNLSSEFVETVDVSAEIEPIIAQQLHYGESGVNPASGNFSFTVTDFSNPAPGGNFVFARYYNSLDQEDEKKFGRGWSSMLDARIHDPEVRGRNLTLVMPNGSTFKYKLKDGVYTCPTTRNTLTKTNNQTYTLKTPSQEEYVFTSTSDSSSTHHRLYRLTKIKDKTGNTVTEIVYANDRYFVDYILDSAERKYTVNYGEDGLIASITDPYGRTVRYDYMQGEPSPERVAFDLMTSWTDYMGIKNTINYQQKDNIFSETVDFPYTDTFISSVSQKNEDGWSESLFAVEYDVKSYSPTYGKVLAYMDSYEEIYTYEYNYMSTTIITENQGGTRTDYYDSYMYVYKTDLPVQTNAVVGRRFYRPDGKNYGEVVQEQRESALHNDLTTYIRDPETGNVQQKVNPDGSTVSYWYDTKNNVIGELDEEENCTLYVYNANNMLIKKARYLQKGFPDIANKALIDQYITQHADQFVVETYAYTNGGSCPYNMLLSQVIDAEGNRISFTYDKYGNILTTSRPHQSGDTVLYDSYEYYVNYLDTADVSAGVQTEAYVDFVDNLEEDYYPLGMEKRTISPLGVTTISYTDNNGMPYKTTVKDGDVEETSRAVYDVKGRKLKEISARAYAENDCAELEEIRSTTTDDQIYYYLDLDPSEEYPFATEYQYITDVGAGYNQVKAMTYPEVDGSRAVKQFDYQKANVIQEIDPDGRELQHTYDYLNRRTKTNTFILDNTNRKRTLSLESHKYSSNAYKEGYQTTISTNLDFISYRPSLGFIHTRNVFVDFRNNVIQNIEDPPQSSESSIETNNSYNKNGTVAKTYNSYGNMVYYVYDTLNRVTETWEAIDTYEGVTYFRYTKKDYYKNGDVKTEYLCTQPVQIPLDTDDRVIPSTEAYRTLSTKEGQTTTVSDYVVTNYTYYADGNVKTVSANNGYSAEYVYDNDGNVSSEIVNGVKTTYENTYFGQPEYKHEYVSLDGLELTDNDVYQIDGENAVLTTEYRYAYGLLMEVIQPNGTSTTYEYDGRDRQVAVSQNGPFIDHEGETVEGIYRTAKKLDWENNLKEETVEEIVDGVSTVISKTVYHPKEDKAWYQNSHHCYLYEQKVEVTAYDPESGDAETRTSLYYIDPAGRIILSISPEDYHEDGVVSLDNIFTDTFSEDPDEMNRTEYEYNSRGKLIREIVRYRDPNENNAWKKVVTKNYKYDEVGNMTEAIDAMGNSTKYVYNLANQVYLEKDPVSQENNYSYSKKYTYDALGRVVKETDSAKYDTTTTYDDINNTMVTTNLVTNPDGTQTEIASHSTFDQNKNLIETYINDPSRKYTYSYNERGQVVAENVPYDATMQDSSSTMKYDSVGNLVQKAVGTDRLEVYAYDAFGNNTAVTVSKADGTEAITTTTEYDSRGNVRFETDGNGNVVQHKYDGFGQEIETIDAHSTTYAYDANGNMISQTDWRGNTTGMTYDPLGRLIQKTDADGTIVEKLYYNDNGLQVKSVDALGNETTFAYDSNNRLLSTTDPLNHTSGQTYNRAGQVASAYDGNGNTTTYEYDELGRLLYTKQTVDGVEEVTSFTYDPYGNLLTQTNGEGHTTTFNYNVANLVTAKIDHEGSGVAEKTESYQYDGRGNIISKTDRNGVTLSYVYDVHNRMLQTKQGETVLIDQTYDANGNKLTMTDESGTTTRTYDSQNRVLTKTVPNIGTSTYQYDITTGVSEGEVAEKTTDPKQNVTIKTYDNNNRLSGVKSAEQATAATYEYYANGAQKKLTNPDGSTAEFAYYADGTLQSLTNKTASGAVIDTYAYTYDAAKNQLTKTETVSGEDRGTTAYTYDSVNRLKTVTDPQGKVTAYTYDKAGNRQSETLTESGIVVSQTLYTYNEQERLLSSVQTAGDITKKLSYQYDYNGNMISRTQELFMPDTGAEAAEKLSLLGVDDPEDVVTVYEYNVFNQMVKAYNGSDITTHTYNGEGVRVQKTVNNETCNYLYEYDKIVLQTDGSGNQTGRNVYGTSLISREADGETFSYHYNGHGDVTALTDTSGVVAASYYYDAFGVELEHTGDVNNPFRYAGYELDEETGLYYLKSRFYDATIARFIQEDTYRGTQNDPLSLNLYTYCANSPLRYWDPSGYAPEDDLLRQLQEDPEALKKYIEDHGGINRNMPADVFQILYNATDNPPSGKPTGPKNRFANYKFSVLDALNWLIQTGGNINFVLQMRDAQDLRDSSGNFDAWLAKDISAAWQADTISMFMQARDMLNGVGQNVNMPSFYLGAVEGHAETLLNTGGRTGIYDQVVERLGGDSSMIAGAYYGEDVNVIEGLDDEQQTVVQVSKFIHEERGKSLLWIPFYNFGEQLDGYFNRISKVAQKNHTCAWGERPLFDTILMQPGTFFYSVDMGLKAEEIDNLVSGINAWNNNRKGSVLGLQFEFDMGLVTGRDDPNYSLRNTEKKARLDDYFRAITKLNPGTPLGIYSGGPNEQGYANPQINAYEHNTGNHRVQDSWQDFSVGNGVLYNAFPAAYDGNLIYDINNYLFRGYWSDKLTNFGLTMPK